MVAPSGDLAVDRNLMQEYDPAKPNDYDEFCRRRCSMSHLVHVLMPCSVALCSVFQRMRQKAEEEMEKRRQALVCLDWTAQNHTVASTQEAAARQQAKAPQAKEAAQHCSLRKRLPCHDLFKDDFATKMMKKMGV